MTDADATIEIRAVAAKLYVLKVGTKKLTLKMVKQLDHFPYPELEPIARVRTASARTSFEANALDDYGIEVVGKHRETGALAWSVVPSEDFVPEAQRLPLIVLT